MLAPGTGDDYYGTGTDPWGNQTTDPSQLGTYQGYPQPGAQQPAQNNWNDADLAAAQAWADQYVQQHNIDPSWGDARDIVARYKEERTNGSNHDQAFANLGTWPKSFGWENGSGADAAGTGGAGGAGGGAGGAGGSGGNGQGLFDRGLYAPFQGQAPSYQQPTLPGAPNFDSYYDASQFQPAQYHAPNYRQAPAFQAGKFTAPTLEEAQNQPGYQFGVQQGEKALQQSRASQGLLRTGGTLKDILDYGRNAATQNYGNVYNQNLGTFKTNEGGRINEYNTNYSTQYKDPNDYDAMSAQNAFTGQLAANRNGLDVAQARFAPAMMQYQTEAQNAQRQSELSYNADWQKYLDSENVFYQNQSGPFSKYLSLAQLGAANA